MDFVEQAYLRISNLSKVYGNFTALNQCSLSMHKGELLSLLGPSGCGKSTLLSLIGGLIHPEWGGIELAGRSLVGLPMNKRNIGIVFQNYALFPHMTVRDNISYGLRMRRAPKTYIQKRTDEMIELLKLGPFAARYPNALSGGQQQRVAIARALAIEPDLILLDEALSALDKNLREEMQLELTLLLRKAGITAILVTHDQREAFTFGDRIAVMNKGVIQQIASGEDIYRKPANDFVLDFLGSVSTIPAKLERAPSGRGLIAIAENGLHCPTEFNGLPGQSVRICLRSDEIFLSQSPTQYHQGIGAKVDHVTFLGGVRRYLIDLGLSQILVDQTAGREEGPPFEGRVYLDFHPQNAFVLSESV